MALKHVPLASKYRKVSKKPLSSPQLVKTEEVMSSPSFPHIRSTNCIIFGMIVQFRSKKC